MQATMMDFPLTLGALLARAERQFAAVELAARESTGALTRFTYRELAGRARGLSAALRQAGIRPGDRIATLMWNRRAHLEAYFGVPAAGAVLHPLNLRQHVSELERIVRHAGDRWLLTESSLLSTALALQRAVGMERVIGVDGPEWEGITRSAVADDAPPAPPGRVAEDAPAGLCYTSGTTGAPRGVLYSHRALVLHSLATALPDSLGLRATDCVLSLVPMFHANAWGIPYTATMVGARQVLAGPHPDAATILDLLAGEQVTFAAGVPMIWTAVLDALAADPRRWRLHPELRVNLGGAPAPLALFRRFDAAGIRVHMGWGMTEISPVGAMNPHFDAAAGDARARQGRPLPLVEARARHLATGAEIAWNDADVGELEVRGPWVAAAYFAGSGGDAAPDASEPAWTEDGWLRTGDMVTLDGEGLIGIVDRRRDMIRSGGEWISSIALENALCACPGVREAAVVAVADAKWEQRPLAAVVVRQPGAVAVEQLRRHLAASFAPWQIPDRFVFLEALPRTGTGKIDKRELRSTLGVAETKGKTA